MGGSRAGRGRGAGARGRRSAGTSRSRGGGNGAGAPASLAPLSGGASARRLFEQLKEQRLEVEQEIQDRQEFLAEMQAMGKGKEHEVNMLGEIDDRMRELERLERAMAELA